MERRFEDIWLARLKPELRLLLTVLSSFRWPRLVLEDIIIYCWGFGWVIWLVWISSIYSISFSVNCD